MSKSEYTFPSELDPSVSTFFSYNSADNWGWDNFVEFYLRENPGTAIKTIYQQYQDNLRKIIKNENVPVNIKGKAGSLSKSAKRKGKRKASTHNVFNINIQNNNGTVFGTATLGYKAELVSKKPKLSNTNVVHTTSSPTSTKSSHRLDNMSVANSFLLQINHVIECGYTIKCNPHTLEDSKNDRYTTATPFKKYNRYTSSVLPAMKEKDMEEAEKVVKQIKITENQEDQQFVKGFFEVCLWIYKNPNLYQKLSISKAGFNCKFVWPVIEHFVSGLDDHLYFIPGERVLQCSDKNHVANGCVLYGDEELSIMDTSVDNLEYGKDHAKLHYGAVQILNSIYQKYFYATKTTALLLRIPIVHFQNGTVHLWIIQLGSPNLYSSHEVFKTEIPKDLSCSGDILYLGILGWCYRCLLKDLVDIIKMMKNQHEEYLLAKSMSGIDEERDSLAALFHLDVQKIFDEASCKILPAED